MPYKTERPPKARPVPAPEGFTVESRGDHVYCTAPEPFVGWECITLPNQPADLVRRGKMYVLLQGETELDWEMIWVDEITWRTINAVFIVEKLTQG